MRYIEFVDKKISTKKESMMDFGFIPYSESALLKGLTPKTAHADEVSQPTAKELGERGFKMSKFSKWLAKGYNKPFLFIAIITSVITIGVLIE